jgi:DNA-binding transcriptional ArsR family regulator
MLSSAVITALESMQADRDRLAEMIGRRRAEFEASISAEVVQLAELEGYIRVIERQQHGGSGTSANGNGTRGRNREKIMPLLAGGKRLTTREISDTTGIGRGSVDRTMHQLAEQGVVNKTDSGWGEVPATTPKS